MEADTFHDLALSLPGASFDVKWGEHRTYCIGPRMFVMAGSLNEPRPRYSFKASEMGFQLLVEHGVARPAPYLQRAKWVQLMAADSLSAEELKAYVRQAYDLVAAKLTRAERRAIGLGG